MLRYAVFDIETSGRKSFGRFCNALDEMNEITCYSLLSSSGKVKQDYAVDGLDRDLKLPLKHCQLLVGQNIKFDLLYIWKSQALRDFLSQGGMVWDTMLAEYLLSGQQINQGFDLNNLSLKYGGSQKNDVVGEMFKAGLMSKEIDKDTLLEYNLYDVKNTEVVFLAQWRQAKRNGMLPLMRAYMNHLLAICEMEYNGLYIDMDIANVGRKKLEITIESVSVELSEAVKNYWPKGQEFILSSAQQWSLLLFGGTLTTIEDIPTGEIFKTGKRKGEQKTKKTAVPVKIPSQFLPKEEWSTKRDGIYSVGDEVLVSLRRDYPKHPFSPLLDKLVEFREASKLLSTYYYKEIGNKTTGLLTKVHPKTSTIHTSFNMALTQTGRLSSSGPNCQNLPAKILDMFTSRYGKDGEICEFDFSQLEVVVQAYLSQSENMIADIISGKDFHRIRLAYALGMSYDDVINVEDYAYKRKTIAKPISFQKAYGAAPTTVSNRTGIPLDIVEKVFAAEDRRYPEIKQFYESVVEEITKTRNLRETLVQIRNKEYNNHFTVNGEHEGFGQYRSITGKLYTFTEKATKGRRGDIFRYWQMPEVQNYPVQGFAADIVATVVGEVYRKLQHESDVCAMICEVHDSLIIDCRKDHVPRIVDLVKGIMNDVPKWFDEIFKLKINVPIKVDFTTGDSWLTCKGE